MMPNSRVIPIRKRSNSASPAYSTPINTKKGFISRLLPKANEDTEKKSGIGKLFKKMSGTKYEENDDIPQVRPVRPTQQYSKIPLAPPPRHRTLSQPPISHHFLTHLPDQYLTQPPVPQPSESQPRKSDGSISIYSTFGSYEHISQESLASYSTVQNGSDEDEFVDAQGYTQEELERRETMQDDVLAQALLNWKRHSGNRRWSIRQCVEEEETLSIDAVREQTEKRLEGERVIESNKSEVLESVKESVEEDEIKRTARQLWNEDESLVSKEKIAEWLGLGKAFNSSVLEQYMQLFEFSDMRLETGFRRLCSKLYFKAEAQQIDRILEAFAKRYWDCNKDSLLESSDVVYAVVYSLLLLNTDLHVAQGKHNRMTRTEFIKNTMPTVLEQREGVNEEWEIKVEGYLKEMYMSVKQHQILQPLTRKTSSVKRGSILGNRRVAGIKRSVNSMIRKSGIVDSMIIPEDFYPLTIQPRKSTSSSQARRNSESSNSNASYSSQNGGSFQQKEGIVMRKHVLESHQNKAKNREWKECYLEINKNGELCMIESDKRQVEKPVRWTSTQWVGKIALNHTLSNLLPPPGYNRQRPHVFAIQQSDGGVYLFQTMTGEQAYEWVSMCNYWAARTSKEGLGASIGNMEYGWGPCLEGSFVDTIHEWIAPSHSMISSILNESEQYKMLQRHVEGLNNEINQHRDKKNKLILKFPSTCHHYSKVITNWETKANYLLHEIIKYQNYCNALEKSLESRLNSTGKLTFKTSHLDLFKEINQELHFNKSFL